MIPTSDRLVPPSHLLRWRWRVCFQISAGLMPSCSYIRQDVLGYGTVTNSKVTQEHLVLPVSSTDPTSLAGLAVRQRERDKRKVSAVPLFLTFLCMMLPLLWLALSGWQCPLAGPSGASLEAPYGASPPYGYLKWRAGLTWPQSTSNEQQGTFPRRIRKVGRTALCCVHSTYTQHNGFKDEPPL